jgi:pilus assembly protein CpaC
LTGKLSVPLRGWSIGVACALLLTSSTVGAQVTQVTRLDLPVGRSYPYTASEPITRVSIANPAVADVVVISERELVVNGQANGETDAIVWFQSGQRLHWRIQVHTAADRMQVSLAVKIAEVRRDALRDIGVSGLYRNNDVRVGTQQLSTDQVFKDDGTITIPGGRFLSVLSDFGTDDFLAFLQAEETRGRARTLAEPNLLVANKDSASFLAGGELPVPVIQRANDAGGNVTIQFREFGVRLAFMPEILSDSLIKLRVQPEVSSLDYANAVLLNGFRIPAFRTRRVTSVVDVRRNESLIISGMFNEDVDRVTTGVPFLKDIPILGLLFSSTSWQRHETEMVVIVTPTIVDPLRPRAQDTIRLTPDTARPAIDALRRKLPGGVPRP